MALIHYADPASWEDWQRAYRYGAFYIFPPDGIIETVDALRERYDPFSAAICRAHVSLSAPLRRPPTERDLAELRARLAAIAPFDIRFGPLRSFLPYPGIVYTITPEEAIVALRASIHDCTLFADRSLDQHSFVPHMTVAEFITVERTATLLRELSGQVPVGSFRCAAIEYAIPDAAFSFARVLRLPLGAA